MTSCIIRLLFIKHTGFTIASNKPPPQHIAPTDHKDFITWYTHHMHDNNKQALDNYLTKHLPVTLKLRHLLPGQLSCLKLCLLLCPGLLVYLHLLICICPWCSCLQPLLNLILLFLNHKLGKNIPMNLHDTGPTSYVDIVINLLKEMTDTLPLL